ncbi:MAG: endopeptidase La [Gammaproteobacteria bacterium]|nr:endopeptidase La [Gammaproteobacteria bacterium]
MPTTKAMIYPVLPLRDVVVYPHMVIPLFVGREKSIKALDAAMEGDKQIFLVAQKEGGINDPKTQDMYQVGTLSTVLQMLKLPDGTVKVLVEGNQRADVVSFTEGTDYSTAEISFVHEVIEPEEDLSIIIRSLLTCFEEYVKINKRIPPEILNSLAGIENPARLADTIAAHVPLSLHDKQLILEARDIRSRLELVLVHFEAEIDKMRLDKRVQKRVKSQMEKSQREYYLNEKMKAIQKELGEIDESTGMTELEQLEDKINKAGMTQEAKTKAMAELTKLKMMPLMSAEATVSRNYLDWLLSVPWKKKTTVSSDLSKAEAVLEHDHFGLERVKERIIEFLAVQQRAKKVKGPILCLVGPPGVGKTSLGESIARATGREFVRISLGGIRDEAEIRGHRRTYIGSLPGKIIQKLAKVKVRNPLFMLDEVDKMAMDFRGDPASALLEVLDPEQNHAFNDHYLEVDYDLSDVMFIATSNSLNIPPALLDRMEVIRLAGYTEDEKLNIALRYLVTKQFEQAGLKPEEISITESGILEIIRHYTREAGVRNLERDIAKICRKVVKELYFKNKKGKSKKAIITGRNIEKYLGVKKFRYGSAEEQNQVGQVTGLAWTEVGGELLKIESAVMPGKGKTTITGRLGDVMQESIQAAMTVVRSRAHVLGIPDKFFQENDIHIHVPEGATPKDGPSAGVGMVTTIVSAITKIPVRADVAMTGEITLRGEVLPIGGLKEKLIAAHRGRIKKVLIPFENQPELKEIPKNITHGLEIIPVRWIDQVLEVALTYQPQPLTAAAEVPLEVVVAKSKSRKKPKRSDDTRAH